MSDLKEQAFRALLGKIVLTERALTQFPRLHYAIAHHRNIRGEAMRFDDKPYLVEIYKDDAPEIILKSSVQTGKSEFLIVSAHSWAEKGLQVLYTLPTIEIRNLFVANRVDKLYQNSPHYSQGLQRSMGSSNSRGLKHFGDKNGAIFFAGSNSSTTFIEKPIDLVIGDEIDRFDLHNYEKADDRMTASPYKFKYEASNPTVDKFGVDARFRQSDQREWYLQCEHCNYWQTMDWFKNVVRQTDDSLYVLRDSEWEFGCGRDIQIKCRVCSKTINRYDIKGQWVAKYPKITKTHGYHIHQMLSSYVRIDLMWDKFEQSLSDDTKMQVFYNSMLGLTFAGAGSKLVDVMLNACKGDYLMPAKAERCFMGVDVGKVLHVCIYQLCPGETLRLVFAGTVKEFEDLDFLFARFEIVSYVIDAMPETRKSTAYAKKHIGRGWICRYHQGLLEIQKNEDTRIVSADRTMIMDRVLSWFSQRKIALPMNAQSLDRGDYYDQLMTPTRIYDEQKNRYDWLGDPDHYFHATVYALMSYIVRGEFSVRSIELSQDRANKVLAERMPDKFEESVVLPPGTPQNIRDHYARLYERIKQGGNEDGKEHIRHGPPYTG